MPRERRPSRRVMVGDVPLGDGAPVSVQSMTSTDTRDVPATTDQISRLADAGCEIVRVAVPAASALDGFRDICAASVLPVVADVHFDHRLAIEAARSGAAKLRINPGNIGSMDDVDEVISAAGEAGIPVRIGVNAGSLADEYRDRDWPLAEKLVASAVAFCAHFAERRFEEIVVSAKASSVPETVRACEKLGQEVPYPLHLGVTEAGLPGQGIVKSAVAMGILLWMGVGDTLRVSLTGDPVQEVDTAWRILAALDLRRRGPELVACPTCGRCRVDLVSIAREVDARLSTVKTPVKVAVMGCVVNGPGEAREADIGVAAGDGVGVLFARGVRLRTVPESEIVDSLMEEIERLGEGPVS